MCLYVVRMRINQGSTVSLVFGICVSLNQETNALHSAYCQIFKKRIPCVCFQIQPSITFDKRNLFMNYETKVKRLKVNPLLIVPSTSG